MEEPDCPELVIVLPKEECGWLERRSMGELRRRTLTYLRGRDRHGRLRVVYPTLTADDDQVLNVHAKLLIVDQRIVKIGSSNWSNRSMGLDTECDAWIAPPATDAHGHPQVRALLSRLLAEHLGTEPGRVEQELAAGKSLFALCDALGDGGRTLCALPVHDSDRALTPFDVSMFDLERPELPEAVADVVLPLRPHAPKRRVLWSVTMTLLALCALGAAVYLGDAHARPLLAKLRRAASVPWGSAWAVGVFGLAALAFVPITLLVATVALAFEPWRALLVTCAP